MMKFILLTKIKVFLSIMRDRLIMSKMFFLFIFLLLYSLFEFVVCKSLFDFKSAVKPINMNDIKNPKIINLQISKERRETYEKMIDDKFDGELFGVETKDLTFKATHGKFDLIFEEMDENNKVIKKIHAIDISNGKYELKTNVKYRVFDKNYPEFSYFYRYQPDKIIWQKRHMKIGEFGCTTSHLRAINEILKSGDEYGIIFEDDLLLKDKFKKKLSKMLKYSPKHFGILKLDGVHNGRSNRWTAWLKSRVRFGENKYFYNAITDTRKIGMTTAYVVSKKFAKSLMDWLQTNELNGADGTADVFLFMTLPREYGYNNIWISKNWIVSQRGQFTHAGSDIGKIN